MAVDSYRKEYRIRRAVPASNSLEVTFPYKVVEREARRHDITVEEFIKHFQAVAHYNNVEGVLYTFEPIDKGKD